MAYTTANATAAELKDTVVTGLESNVNALLAAQLQNNIIGVDFIARDKGRRQGRTLDCQIAYETNGDVLLTSPYLLTSFIGTTLGSCAAQNAAFQLLNPGWFYAVPDPEFINYYQSANKPYILFQFYCQDPNGVLNWKINNPVVVSSVYPVISVAVSSTLTFTDRYIKQTANGITTSLPAAPLSGEVHHVRHAGGGANNTLSGNGKNINSSSGTAATVTLVDGDSIQVKYDLINDEWVEFT